LVRHNPWSDDRLSIVLTADGTWRLAEKSLDDGSLRAARRAPDLQTRWVDIGDALKKIAEQHNVPIEE
jgi:hypothetical protein